MIKKFSNLMIKKQHYKNLCIYEKYVIIQKWCLNNKNFYNIFKAKIFKKKI
jgi:hypothetical protein